MRENTVTYASSLTSFRFFVNDFSTRTQGVGVVTTWTPKSMGGKTAFRGTYNFIDTAVTTFSEEHFDKHSLASLTLGRPRTRWNAEVKHVENRLTLTARLHWYGAYWDRDDARRSERGTTMSYLYPLYSGKPLIDLNVGFPFKNVIGTERKHDVMLSFGADNIVNTYPDNNPGAVVGVGNRYGQSGPFGFNGGYYYIHVNYQWGSE